MLANWAITDGIIADFNLNLLRPDRVPTDRQSYLTAFVAFFLKRGLDVMPCENGDTTLDHVVARHDVVRNVRQHAKELFLHHFTTDHPALEFDWYPESDDADAPRLNADPDARTFDLHYLRDTFPHRESTERLLKNTYKFYAPELTLDLHCATNVLAGWCPPPCTAAAVMDDVVQNVIDFADAQLLDVTQKACMQVLGERSQYREHGRHRNKIDFTSAPSVIDAFAKRQKTSTRLTSGDPSLPALEDSYRRWHSYWRKTDRPNEQLTLREAPPFLVTVKEVRKLIAQRKNRASHSDGIHAMVVKALASGSFSHHLTSLFNLCLTYQITPSRWNEALTVMMPKDDTNSTSECRPLSIVPIFRSLFEALIKRKLTPFFDRLHPSQTGFRVGSNVNINLQRAHTDKRPIKVLVDFEKAYDSPDFANLYRSWEIFGLPSWSRRLLHHLYLNHMRCRLHVNGESSEVIHRTQGLFQGTILSPQLFNVYIDDLLKELNDDDDCTNAFADDLLLSAESERQAQSKLNQLNTWSGEHSMKVSTKKTVVLGATSPIYHRDGSEVKRVTTATYLGIPLTVNGLDWQSYYSETISACRRQLHIVSGTTWSWPPTARVDIFKTFILPKLEYGGTLFVDHAVTFDFEAKKPRLNDTFTREWEAIEKLQKQSAALLLKQKQFTGPLFNMLDWTSLCVRWLRQSIWHKIKNKEPPDTVSQNWFDQFQQWLLAEGSTAFNVRQWKRFTDAFLQIPPPKTVTIHRQLNAVTQYRIALYRRHCFSAKGVTCFCGQPFRLASHKSCLPLPFGPLDTLFTSEKWREIEQLLAMWSERLNPHLTEP